MNTIDSASTQYLASSVVRERNGRVEIRTGDCVGIELNPAYVDIARERLGLSDMPKDVDIFA